MSVYSGPVFEMAAEQFGVIANHLSIPFDERDRLLLPKRAVVVSCPIHRDDGSVAVFEGYRVQHHLTLGPTKGGTRFAPSVDLGEVAALAIPGRPLLPLNETIEMIRHGRHYDCTKAQSELGLASRPIQETLSDSLAWFREHGYLEKR